jgi:hypothetical protein
MDPIIIAAIITAAGGIVVAIFSRRRAKTAEETRKLAEKAILITGGPKSKFADEAAS